MGAWDVGSFSNDTALDFVQSIEEKSDIVSTVQNKRPSYIDADEASEILAACDLVAAMMGRPASDTPEAILSKIAGFDAADEKLINDARGATVSVRDNSELAELWAEDNDQDWSAAIDDLLNRLDPEHDYSAPTPSDDLPEIVFGHCFVCENSIAEKDAIDLIHKIDDGVVHSTMTLHAHRHCVEQQFDPPHWNKDGSPSETMLKQFRRFIGVEPSN